MMLGCNDVAEAQLREPYCGQCGKAVRHLEFPGRLRVGVVVGTANVGSLGCPRATPYRDPVENVLDHAQCEGESWSEDVTAVCACGFRWETTVVAVLIEQN